MPLLNAMQYKTMREEAIINDGQAVDTNSAPDLIYWGTDRNTNFKKMVTGNPALFRDARVAVSGGDTLMSCTV